MRDDRVIAAPSAIDPRGRAKDVIEIRRTSVVAIAAVWAVAIFDGIAAGVGAITQVRIEGAIDPIREIGGAEWRAI